MGLRNWLRIVVVGGLLPAAGPFPLFGAEARLDGVRIPGYERIYRNDDPEQVAAGLLLLGELNCVACHAAGDAAGNLPPAKEAPILDQVGQRVRPEYYQAFLAAPHAMKPGTTMPSLLVAADPAAKKQAEQQVAAVSHFLASLGSPIERAPAASQVERGKQQFQRVGCTACHDPPEADAPRLTTSMPLGNLAAKYSIPSLAQFLADPLHVRPSGRMPALNLTPAEASDIAAYLLRELKIPAGLTYRYFEGSWQELPDFATMKPKSTGPAHSFDVGVAPRTNNFGLLFEGKLGIPKAGEYTFHLGSDDGSRLWIDDKQVVDCDGIHPFTVRSGKVQLASGEHSIRVAYFEQGGEERLLVEAEGPGLARQPAEGLLVVPDDKRVRFQADAELARAGRDVFQRVGCAACHRLQHSGKRLASTLEARPLRELTPDGGCLSESPAAGLPRYALDAEQRQALRAALAAVKQPLPKPTDAAAIHRTLTTMNCYACHQRGELGGVEDQRNAYFQSNQPEMGDEGRIPPTLNGVGDKLRPQWMQRVFQQGAKDREYMYTRMPRFGDGQLRDLAEALAREDQAQPPTVTADFSPRRLKVAGRQMAGGLGYSCIKCHTFAKYKSEGIQAISLTTMTQRLNEGWFQRYMLNPQAYRPGTRMPSAWPNGKVLLPKILDGTAGTQIHAIWTYLSDGDRAAVPPGLQTAQMELVPVDKPIIYRNFIEGAGPRAIGVGYPERVNLAFDANNLRPAMLWQGPFIDASRHWNGRGQGFEPPLGDNVLRLPDGPPLFRLAGQDDAWPGNMARELGYQFLGYRLDEQGRPAFEYRFGDVAVTDAPTPIARDAAADASGLPALRRSLEFVSTTPTDDLWMRVAVAPQIEDLGDGWYSINSDWRLRLKAAGMTPRIRKTAAGQELLLPVVCKDGRAAVVLEYHW